MLFLKLKDQSVYFSETYGIPLMFDAFFISVSIILIPPMTKK
jgi:hypothetical protein